MFVAVEVQGYYKVFHQLVDLGCGDIILRCFINHHVPQLCSCSRFCLGTIRLTVELPRAK